MKITYYERKKYPAFTLFQMLPLYSLAYLYMMQTLVFNEHCTQNKIFWSTLLKKSLITSFFVQIGSISLRLTKIFLE